MTSRRNKWGNYVKTGLEVATDAAYAGETVASLAKSKNLLSAGQQLYDKYQEYQGYYNQITNNYRQQQPQISYRGQPPVVVAGAYRQPPQQYLGPMQKKIIIFLLIFALVMIIISIIVRQFVRSYQGCSKSI